MRDLIRQTYQGLCGDSDKRAGVDAQLCTSVIEHSHGLCSHLVEQDDALSGTIDELSTESTVVQPDIEQDINADMDPFPDAGVEDDEQQQYA
jgi:hypothetical protein